MLRNKLFKICVCYVTAIAFGIASLAVPAPSLAATLPPNPLPPISKAHMYKLASQGNVKALRYAVQRGLDIDTMDRNGNTGMCHAIQKRDFTAYNAFRAAGSNPQHPCTQRIDPKEYNAFMRSGKVVPIDQKSRDAYALFKDEEYGLDTKTWVIGGLLAAGGLLALIMGGGGGGGGVAYPFYETNYSLAGVVGTKVPEKPEPGYRGTVVHGANGENNEHIRTTNDEIFNNSEIRVGSDDYKKLTELLNLNEYVMKYSDYIVAYMKSTKGALVQFGNADGTSNATLTLGNAVAGIVALGNNSLANNFDTINIQAQNGTFGLIAGDWGEANNFGVIDLSMIPGKGDSSNVNNQLNGMYADTKASAYNYGSIDGIGTINGTLIGMQARLINQLMAPDPNTPTRLVNAAGGEITLRATTDANNYSAYMIGMGSFEEKEFWDGINLFSRAGFVELRNLGDITISLEVINDGVYTSNLTNDGKTGIIGMRAAANTNAYNENRININLQDAGDISNVHAGMVAAHGGKIYNSGTVDVKGGLGGYGMLVVRGEGSNAEIDNLNGFAHNTSSGTITVDSTDGFGMASYFNGVLFNEGQITLKKKGTGMYTKRGQGINNKTIDMTQGGVGMKADERGTITNGGGGVINMDTTYNESKGMLLEDGFAYNDGTINIKNGAIASYGIYAVKGMAQNRNIINVNMLDSYGMFGETATTVNSGNINFSVKGWGSYTVDGIAQNAVGGNINMNFGGVGMYAENGSASNAGNINMLLTGTGMETTVGYLTNESSGVITFDDLGTGMNVTGTGRAINKGRIVMKKGGTGIKNESGEGTTINEAGGVINMQLGGTGLDAGDGMGTNRGTINVDGAQGIGMKTNSGRITNYAQININYGGDAMYGDSGSTVINERDGVLNVNAEDSNGIHVSGATTVQNIGYINVNGHGANGILDENGSNILNIGRIVLSSVAGQGSGIKGKSGSNITNKGTIDIYAQNSAGQGSYGIWANGGTVINDVEGRINPYVSDGNTGIYMTGGGTVTNWGLLGSVQDAIAGLIATNNYKVIHIDGGSSGDNRGDILLKGKNSHGIYVSDGSATNSKVIEITGTGTGTYGGDGERSSAMYAIGSNASVTNQYRALINVYGDFADGIRADDEGTGTNSGTINVASDTNFSHAMFANGGHLVNEEDGVINMNNFKPGQSAVFVTGGGDFTNKGTINTTTSDVTYAEDYDVIHVEDGTATNESEIPLTLRGKNSNIIHVLKGEGINKGKLEIESIQVMGDELSSAMYAEGVTSTITNDSAGEILAWGNGGIGMRGRDQATLDNHGNIFVGDKAADGTIKKASASYGMYLDDRSVGTNDGTITVGRGTQYPTPPGVGETHNPVGDTVNYKSKAMYIAGQSTMDHSGTIKMHFAKGQSNAEANPQEMMDAVLVTGNNSEFNNDGEIVTVLEDNNPLKALNYNVIRVHNGGTANNNSTITLHGKYSNVMMVEGDGLYTGRANNNGTINLYTLGGDTTDVNNSGYSQSLGSYGLYVNFGGQSNNTVYNASGATINIFGDNEMANDEAQKKNVIGAGVRINGGGKFDNDGDINIDVTAINVDGIQSVGTELSSITNNGNIILNNVGYDGTNKIGRKGIYSTNSNVINNGTITLRNFGYGIYILSGTAINKKQITVGKDGDQSGDSIGMYLGGGANGQLENSGTIDVYGNEKAIGMQIVGNNASIKNSGTVTVNGGNSSGLFITGNGSIENQGKVTVNNNSRGDSYGLNISGLGNITNTADVYVDNTVAKAWGLKSNGTITNSGTVFVRAKTDATGFDAGSGGVNNTAKLTVQSSEGNAFGILANGTSTNTAEVKVVASDGKSAWGTGGSPNGARTGNFTNTTTGTISVEGGMSTGMAGSTLTNSGKVEVTGSSSAVGLDAANSATNSSGSKLTVNGQNSAIGIRAANATNNGEMDISSSGGSVVGIDVTGSASNGPSAKLNVTGTSAIGMRGKDLTNSRGGTINVTGSNSAVGMQVTAGGTAVNDGLLTVTGPGAIGLDGSKTNGASLSNSGRIVVSGSGAIGIYGSPGGSVSNSGVIIHSTSGSNPETCPPTGCPPWIVLNGATLTNYSKVEVSGMSLRLNTFGGAVMLARGGQFISDVGIDGTVYTDSSIVGDGFEDEYKVEDAFVGKDEGIDLQSGSVMYSSRLVTKEGGGHDVVVRMKTFDEVMGSNEMSSYLDANRDLKLASDVFTDLNRSPTLDVLHATVTDQFGLDLIPNFAKQNLDVLKSVNASITNSLFEAKVQQGDQRVMVGYDFFNREQDGMGALTGYEDQAQSVYVMGDRSYNETLRIGLGASLSYLDSDYDNKDKRDEVMVQLFAPLTAKFADDLTLVSTPRIGYGMGNYHRYVGDGFSEYKADTKNFYYGISNEVRKGFDLGPVVLEPSAEFNILGVYQDELKEKNGLTVKSSNNLSVEAGVGLYARKDFELSEQDTLKFRVGGSYYHEFNNSFQASKASMSGMAGSFHMESYKTQRNRGVLSASAIWKHQMLNFYLQVSQYLEDKSATQVDAGVRVDFE